MDQLLRPLILLAGLVHLLIAIANFFAPRKLRYREALAGVRPIVRQIFFVHSAYIIGLLFSFAALCLAFPDELLGASRLGRALSAFLAIFWAVRVFVQLFYYESGIKRENPAFHVLFTLAFAYLAAVFTAAALLAP